MTRIEMATPIGVGVTLGLSAGVLLEKDHTAAQPVEAKVFLEQLEEGRPRLVGESVHKMADLIDGH